MKITSFCVAGEPQGKARPLWTIAVFRTVMIAARLLLRQETVVKQSNGSIVMKHGAFLTTLPEGDDSHVGKDT